ncbi:MAG: ArsC family reductase [Mucilaginibacter polytrichastri]|nr:ArsC family reductase [Mucilaginibacter polytrichastri]
MNVFGIPNCNTVKKALDWMRENNVPADFHDFKKEGVSREQLKKWIEKEGWEALLNRKGMTWRQLSDEVKLGIDNEDAAIELMMEKPSVIKRPVIEAKEHLIIGFDAGIYEKALKK